MKKNTILTTALILIILLVNTAYAAGELTVSQENFVVLPYKTYYEALIYAELKNTGDKPVEFNAGLFELFTADGEPVSYLTLVWYDCCPEVLQPEEMSFIRARISFEAPDIGYVTDYSFSIIGRGSMDRVVTRFTTVAEYQRDTNRAKPIDYIIATIKNDTEDTLFGYYVTYALKNAEGKLLYTNTSEAIDAALMPHSSTQLRFQIDESAVAYIDANDLVPVTAEAIAYRTAAK